MRVLFGNIFKRTDDTRQWHFQCDRHSLTCAFSCLQALDALSKRDLNEIKSYARPPPLVEKVMEAVMLLKCVEPTWAEAKRQLGDPNFITQVRTSVQVMLYLNALPQLGSIQANHLSCILLVHIDRRNTFDIIARWTMIVRVH